MRKLSFTLHTKAQNGSAFNCRRAMKFELPSDKILCNEEPILSRLSTN
jgi:hypothetical protein